MKMHGPCTKSRGEKPFLSSVVFPTTRRGVFCFLFCLLFHVALPECGNTQIMSADTYLHAGALPTISAHCLLGFLSHLLQDRSLQKSSQASPFPEACHPSPRRVGRSESTVPSTARRSRHQVRGRQETRPTTVSPNTWWYHWPEARTSRTLGPALPAAALGRMRLTPTNPNPPHTHAQASAGAREREVAGRVRNWRPAVPGRRGWIDRELVTGRWQEERAEAPSTQRKIHCPKVKHKFEGKVRISGWQPRSAELQEWCPSQSGILNDCTSYRLMKLVLSREKGWKAFMLCLWIIAKVSRFFITSFLQKCQEETVRFLAMQKLCDFGIWSCS